MTTFTYLISDQAGHAKIGKARDPRARVKRLQTGNPHQLLLVGLVAGDYESTLHWMCRGQCRHDGVQCDLKGEWFPEAQARAVFFGFGPVSRIAVQNAAVQNAELDAEILEADRLDEFGAMDFADFECELDAERWQWIR